MPKALKNLWREIQTLKNGKIKSHSNSTNCNILVINHSQLTSFAFELTLHQHAPSIARVANTLLYNLRTSINI
jgi:hypothetical protein